MWIFDQEFNLFVEMDSLNRLMVTDLHYQRGSRVVTRSQNFRSLCQYQSNFMVFGRAAQL